MENDKSEPDKPYYPTLNAATVQKVSLWSLSSFRLRVAILLLLHMFFTFGVRLSLSMAMVCMMNSTALALMSEDSKQFIHPSENTTNNATRSQCVMSSAVRSEYEGPLVWTSDQQGLVFSAMGWGGFFTSFPSGWLADRYGAKNILLIDAIVNVALMAVSPIVALRGGYVGLFVVRFIIGFCQGCQYPCLASLMAKWIPASERATVLGLTTAGNQLSAVLWIPIAALMCQHKEILGGWPAIFYILGAFGLLVCIPWPFVVSNSAEKNKRISEKEKLYIMQQIEGQHTESRKAATSSLPWRAMLRSPPILACMTCDFCTGMFVSLLSSYLPTYFKDVLLLDLNSNGLYAMLPWLAGLGGKIIPPLFGDYLKEKTSISPSYICKGYQFISSFGTAALLIGLSFVNCTQPLVALGCLLVGTFTSASYMFGYYTCEISIAPKFAGIIMSFGVTCYQVGLLIGPYIIGAITVHGTQSEWRTVFLVLSGGLIVSGCGFGLFGTVEVQPWALSSKESQANLVHAKNSQVSLTEDWNRNGEPPYSIPIPPLKDEEKAVVQF